jgi:hypothetical protein
MATYQKLIDPITDRIDGEVYTYGANIKSNKTILIPLTYDEQISFKSMPLWFEKWIKQTTNIRPLYFFGIDLED